VCQAIRIGVKGVKGLGFRLRGCVSGACTPRGVRVGARIMSDEAAWTWCEGESAHTHTHTHTHMYTYANADPYVDWYFGVTPTHRHHEHSTPLPPARDPHSVLHKGENQGVCVCVCVCFLCYFGAGLCM